MATFPSFSGTLGATQRNKDYTDFDVKLAELNDPRSVSNAIRLNRAKNRFAATVGSAAGSVTDNPLAGVTSVYQPGNLFGSPTVGGAGSFMNKFGTFQDIPGSGNALTSSAVANATSGKVAVDTSGLNRNQIDSLKLKFGDKFLEVGPKEAMSIYTGGLGGSSLAGMTTPAPKPEGGGSVAGNPQFDLSTNDLFSSYKSKRTSFYGTADIYGNKRRKPINSSSGSGVKKS